MKKIEVIEESIKFKAFGKTKQPTRKKQSTNKRISEEDLIRKQSKKIEDDIINVKKEKNGRVGQVYSMMKYLNGDKKKSQEPVAIKDPITKQLIVAPEDIKNVTLKYCVGNLTNKRTSKEDKEERGRRLRIHDKRMEVEEDEEFNPEYTDFEDVLRKFSSKS